MQRILFIVEHLSTGGQPCWTLKNVEAILSDFEVFLVEFSNFSDEYVLHKNKIKQLLQPNHFFTLKHDKTELLTIINDIGPNVIHFSEVSEYFIPHPISEQIFNNKRKYKIFCTTHSSDFNINNIIWKPDKYLFVSPWSAIQYTNLDVDYDIIKFPIDNPTIIEKDKRIAKEKLKLNLDKKQILTLGLWTERKSQGSIVELARELLNYPIHFNFVGNAAPNFAYYHSKYLNNLPPNCTFWGEQEPGLFLKAADLQIFASKGKIGDMELRPLIITESLQYDLPILLNNLDVYLDEYDNNSLVHYLTGNSDQDCKKILKILNIPEKTENEIQNQPIQEILNNYLTIYYNEPENKIYINSNYSQNLYFDACSIKELDSEIPIYFWEKIEIHPGCGIWAIPIGNYNFANDDFCGGFLVELYKDNKIIYHKEIRLKPRINKPRINNLTPFDCLYINYKEFFGTKIYDDFVCKIDKLNLVIDVGANCGLASFYFQTMGAKEIYCLEPDSKAFANLEKLFNNNSAVHCLNLALSDVSGDGFLCSDIKNSTISKLGETGTPIKTIGWNDFLIQNNLKNKQIDLVKIDIEGFEYQVFTTITMNHLQKINNIILEFHENTNGKLNNIVDKLIGAGFKLSYQKQSSKEIAHPSDLNGVIFATRIV